MSSASVRSIVDVASRHAVEETADRLAKLLQSKGIALFATIDHSGEAAKAGLTMRPTRLLIFGSPKAGTPVMVAAPRSAIDLPLKALVWEDEAGEVFVSYNDPDYLHERFGVAPALLGSLRAIEAIVRQAAE